jgi:Flp pilus assembly protein TadG
MIGGLRSSRGAGARRCAADRGSLTLEYALLAPTVLMMLFLCIQVALFSYARSVALTAAQEGANAQRAYGAQAGDGKARATEVLNRQGDTLSGWKVTVTTNGNQIQVTVTGRSLSLFPGFSGYHISQSAGGPVERFIR